MKSIKDSATREELLLYIETLEIENADFRQKIKDLRAELGLRNVVFPREWGITAHQAQILAMLYNNPGKTVKKEMLYNELYGMRVDVMPDMKIIDIYISHIRKKISTAIGTEITIDTEWGVGYGMGTESHRKLKEIIDKSNAAYLTEDAVNDHAPVRVGGPT